LIFGFTVESEDRRSFCILRAEFPRSVELSARCATKAACSALAHALLSIRLMKHSTTHQSGSTDQPGLQRDPEEWKTGDEPMTDAQRSYLETLSREAGEEFDGTLTKADASKRIDELRSKSPRLANE
jgi:hypothetical protein